MPLQLNIKSRPTCTMLVGPFFARLLPVCGLQAKKPPQGATVGKVSSRHPDGKLSMRVQACIDGGSMPARAPQTMSASRYFVTKCGKHWRGPSCRSLLCCPFKI